MKLAHFVITRFCLRDRKLLGGVDGPWLGSVNPLRPRAVNFRLKLLEMICLPGLLSQTNQNFTWILLVDSSLQEGFKARLRNLASTKDRVVLHEYRTDPPDRLETLGWLRPLLADRPDYVCTTFNDDDDALPRRFVDVVQSHTFELNGQGRLPPFKFMGAKRIVQWNMLFTPDAPLGWEASWRGRVSLACSGFSLLCRYPAFDFSILGMRHRYAETYFDFHAPPPVENVRFYRESILKAARDARIGRIPMGDDAFFDVSRQSGAVLMSNHGANNQSWRLPLLARTVRRTAHCPPRRVLGAGTFPDVSLDWDAVRRYSHDFKPWRVNLRLLERKWHGHKGRNIEAIRRFRSRIHSLLG